MEKVISIIYDHMRIQVIKHEQYGMTKIMWEKKQVKNKSNELKSM